MGPTNISSQIADGKTGPYDTSKPFVGNYGRNAFYDYQKKLKTDPNTALQVTDFTPEGRPKVDNALGFSEEFIKAYDTNKDGVLSETEFLAVSEFKGRPDVARNYFRTLDTDKNNQVDLVEKASEIILSDGIARSALENGELVQASDEKGKKLIADLQALAKENKALLTDKPEPIDLDKMTPQQIADAAKKILAQMQGNNAATPQQRPGDLAQRVTARQVEIDQEIAEVQKKRELTDAESTNFDNLKKELTAQKEQYERDGIIADKEREATENLFVKTPTLSGKILTSLQKTLDLGARAKAFHAGQQYVPAK